MAGRNDVVIVAALEAMAQALEHQLNVGENAASRNLDTFQRENPPVFKGTNDPNGALTWVKEIERIFRVMDCTPNQKVRYGTYMLVVKIDDWWLETRQRLEANGEEVTWVVFSREFLRKYFPKDVRGKKEIEFLELRQWNKLVVEYAAKFGELAKLYQHYDGPTGGNNAHYRVISEKRGKSQQGRGKPYDTQVGKGKQKATEGKRTSGGDALAGIVCFKYGKVGHKSNVCTADTKRCFCCGKLGHEAPECMHKEMVCFNYGEEGHVVSKFQKPNKEQASGKVFAFTPLITIIDTGATHCFISADCVERLSLVLSAMNGEMVVDTPAKGSEEVQVFVLVASLSVENQALIYELQVVREFPEVFPNEIPDVPPKREVEFSIDLVPGTRPVSMAPYRMSAS
ncbi:uncharacterized protein LOC131624885 [Vicia villosa]|uniref:uncharacterized protein LOC131624885 n=1 Tax=Vicia villosa TaxID=3911 RepID=UPI00273BC1B9|nr:uncharacterized protein LOC131624885 [Vicia villosa]